MYFYINKVYTLIFIKRDSMHFVTFVTNYPHPTSPPQPCSRPCFTPRPIHERAPCRQQTVRPAGANKPFGIHTAHKKPLFNA